MTDPNGNAISFTSPGGYWAQVYGYQITTASFPFTTGSANGGFPQGPLTSVQVNAGATTFTGYSNFEYDGNNLTVPNVLGTDSRFSSFPYIDIRAFGAVGDGVQLTHCSITSGTPNLSCPNGPSGKDFTSCVVGKLIAVKGAGATVSNTDNSLITTIKTCSDATDVVLNANASATTNGGCWATGCGETYFGTDNATAFCNATQCSSSIYTGIFGDAVLSGRELYLPGGFYLTSKPLYCRNNMTCIGAGQGGTQIMIASLAHPLAAPATVSFNTNTLTPTICFGWNNGTSGNCAADGAGVGGGYAAYDIVATSVGAQTTGVFGNAVVTPVLHNIWTQSYYGFACYLCLQVSVSGFVNDTSTVGIALIGDGSATPSRSYGNQIVDSQFGYPKYGIWLDGIQDTIIANNNGQSGQGGGYFTWIYSPSSHSSYRINVNGNSLVNSNGGAGGTNWVELDNPCIDCSIIGNQFALSNGNDIVVNNNGTTNLLIAYNHSYAPQYSFFAASTPTAGNWIGSHNVVESPGQYGIFSGNMSAEFDNNTCSNPFTVHAPINGLVFDNACFLFTGSVASTVVANANTELSSGTPCTGSTKCPAIGIDGAAAEITASTSNNTSDLNGCAACYYDNHSGISTSWLERSHNYAATGDALFITKLDPVAGVMIVPGTTTLSITAIGTSLSIGGGGTIANSNLLPQATATQTAGQVVCIKTTGPPPTYGTCTALTAGTGACGTCN